MKDQKTDSKAIIISGPAINKCVGLSTHISVLLNSDLSNRFKMNHFETQGPLEAGDPPRSKRFLQFLWSPFPLIKMIFCSHACAVHINTFMNFGYFVKASLHMLVAKLMGKKVIYQLHGGSLPEAFCSGKPYRRALLKLTLRVADAVVLLNKAVNEAFTKFSPNSVIRLIPNAIDLEPFATFSQRNYKEKKSIKLLYIGRLSADKGIMELIEAMSLLKASAIFNTLHLSIAGKGPLDFQTALEEKVGAFGLSDKVTLRGPVFGDKKLELFKESDIFMLPTYLPEGLPYAVLESLAAGLPMITTNVEGIRDAIVDGEHGVFVESRNAHAIASALERLLQQKELLNHMSENCRKRAAAHYGIDRLENQFSDLYKEICGGRSK